MSIAAVRSPPTGCSTFIVCRSSSQDRHTLSTICMSEAISMMYAPISHKVCHSRAISDSSSDTAGGMTDSLMRKLMTMYGPRHQHSRQAGISPVTKTHIGTVLSGNWDRDIAVGVTNLWIPKTIEKFINNRKPPDNLGIIS